MLMVRKDLWESGEIKTAADLKGRTVAAAGGPGSGGEYLLSKALETGGLSIFDVEMVNVGNADMPAAMESQSIEAALTGSPYATTMEEAGTAVPLVKDMAPGAMTVVYVYSGKFMQERPEVARAFTIGLMEGARTLQGDQYLSDENIGAYMQFVSATEDVIRKAPKSLYDPDLGLRTETLMDAQQTHMKNGRLEYDEPIPVQSVVDPSWQEYALMVLGPYSP
jgi:NitT/TauT family transport system substrate-binding protein